MAIHILFGPGGSGKSYFQIRWIYNELTTTIRNVVTNLSIDIPALQAYIEKVKPEASVDVSARLRLLTEPETKEFWTIRGPKRPNPHSEYGELIDIDKGVNGVLYVIDEAGACGFDANGWAQGLEGSRGTRGQRAVWYLDQQRKFGDDVVASCNGRRPAAIAKPFRDKAHAFIRLKNGYLSQWGMFKGKGQFSAKWFQVEPDKNTEHYREDIWKMDATGLAACYRTAEGVGVVGTTADIGKKAKGIPIGWAIPACILIGAALMLGVPKLISMAVQKTVPVSKKEENRVGGPSVAPTVVSERTDKVIAPSPNPNVFVTGVVHRGGEFLITLSDGRMLTETTQDYLRLHRGGVETPKGTHYPFAKIVPKPPDLKQPEKPPEPVKHPDPPPEYKGEGVIPFSPGIDKLTLTPSQPAPVSNSRAKSR